MRHQALLETEIFLGWAESRPLSYPPERIGELLEEATARLPQCGYFSAEYIRERFKAKSNARRTLENLLTEFITDLNGSRPCNV